MADEFVWHQRLHKHGKDGKAEHLRQCDEKEFLKILKEFVVVVAGNRLHENADDHGGKEQDDVDEGNGGEFGKPVDRFVHGQGVVDAIEFVVAFAPNQFGRVERTDDNQEKERIALYGSDHQVSDGPDVFIADLAGVASVQGREADDESDNCPEGNLTGNGTDAQAG